MGLQYPAASDKRNGTVFAEVRRNGEEWWEEEPKARGYWGERCSPRRGGFKQGMERFPSQKHRYKPEGKGARRGMHKGESHDRAKEGGNSWISKGA